ncbi:hypothetical protein H0H87_009982 [Tephrocybe sp. NHM501043]|nr:hypothetical protein H0H87_009982 [Tephrocybe sp. NHM501043]
MDAFLKKEKGRGKPLEILNILEGQPFSTSDNDFSLTDDSEVKDCVCQEKKLARKANKAAGAAKAKKKLRHGDNMEVINISTQQTAINTQSGDMNDNVQKESSTASTSKIVEPLLLIPALLEVTTEPIHSGSKTLQASTTTTTSHMAVVDAALVAPAASVENPPATAGTLFPAVAGTVDMVPAAPVEIPTAITTSACAIVMAHKAPIKTYGKSQNATWSTTTIKLTAAANKLARLQVHSASTSTGQYHDTMEVDDHPCTSPLPPVDTDVFMDDSGSGLSFFQKSSSILKMPPCLVAHHPTPGSPKAKTMLKQQWLAQNHALFSQLTQEDSISSKFAPTSDLVKLHRAMEIKDSSNMSQHVSSIMPYLNLIPNQRQFIVPQSSSPISSKQTPGSSRSSEHGSSTHQSSSPVLRHATFLRNSKDKDARLLGAPPVAPISWNPFQKKTKK